MMVTDKVETALLPLSFCLGHPFFTFEELGNGALMRSHFVGRIDVTVKKRERKRGGSSSSEFPVSSRMGETSPCLTHRNVWPVLHKVSTARNSTAEAPRGIKPSCVMFGPPSSFTFDGGASTPASVLMSDGILGRLGHIKSADP